MTMMFEVQDLAVASPATVSRCGMVYLEPSYIGIDPFVECWLRFLPENIYPYKEKLQDLFSRFMEVCIWSVHSVFVKKNSHRERIPALQEKKEILLMG